MPRVNLPIVLAFVLTGLVAILSFQVTPVNSAAATHLVISEIMTRGTTASDEFVELYNPTGSAIDLTGWKLGRKVTTTETNLVSSMSGTIASHGFFLMTSNESTASGSADLVFSTNVGDDNTFYLRQADSALIDKVAIGTGPEGEGSTSATVPGNGHSTERKTNSTSTIASMMIGGLDELLGNAEDTDNNGNDFLTREIPQPQNSASTLEPVAGPTPSPSVSASPSASLSPSPSASASPSASPVASINPSPVVSPSVSPSASVTPSIIPSISPNPSPFVFRTFTLQCEVTYREIRTPFFMLRLPKISCGWIPG